MDKSEDKSINVGLPCEETLNTEKLSTLLQMYNMAHNELLVRIQQRDQYHVCMIGALIAASVGIFGMDGIVASTVSIALRVILFVFSLISCGVMLFLTYLLCESYAIYNRLIKHVRKLEKLIKRESKLDTKLWQHKIDKKSECHRRLSSFWAKAVFFIMDAFLLGITILTAVNLIASLG